VVVLELDHDEGWIPVGLPAPPVQCVCQLFEQAELHQKATIDHRDNGTARGLSLNDGWQYQQQKGIVFHPSFVVKCRHLPAHLYEASLGLTLQCLNMLKFVFDELACALLALGTLDVTSLLHHLALTTCHPPDLAHLFVRDRKFAGKPQQ
jgi:hypothetical protein